MSTILKKSEFPFINMKILHKGENVDGDNYQLLTIKDEGKAGYLQCVNKNGDTVKTRLNCTTKIIISDDVEKNKSILTYQKDKIYSKREGADKKKILWDGFLNSFVEEKNGNYYKVTFTEVAASDGSGVLYLAKFTKELVLGNVGDDESTEKMAAAVSSAEREPPAGLDLLAEAVESKEKSGDETKDGYEGDSDATIALVSSTSETEEEKQAAAGLDALLSGSRRRKREEDESVIAAKAKDDKADILSESTKQDVNAYIETIKQGRSELFEKAMTSLGKDGQLQDKKSSLEEERSSLKVDLSVVKTDSIKEVIKSNLLENQTELLKVESLMDAEEEESQKMKEYIQATILKELGGNEAEGVASRPLKKRRVEGDGISLDESTMQDVKAYIETTKQGRLELIAKATADMKDDSLHDKKSSLEEECSSLKLDLSAIKTDSIKEVIKSNLLENQKELDVVVAQLKEKVGGVQQAINAIIIKKLEGNEDAMH